jgi:hypothetical protein
MEAPHYCTRCGAQLTGPDDPHVQEGGRCPGAKVVNAAELVSPEGVRCPVDGCTWFLKARPDRSNAAARQLFESHLEWHQRQESAAPAPRHAPTMLPDDSLRALALEVRDLCRELARFRLAVERHTEAVTDDRGEVAAVARSLEAISQRTEATDAG